MCERDADIVVLDLLGRYGDLCLAAREQLGFDNLHAGTAKLLEGLSGAQLDALATSEQIDAGGNWR